MVTRKHEVLDPYATARFGSLWQVVVHATEPEEDRHKLYAEAHAAMVKDRRWGEYGMVFHTTASGHKLHVGFRFANPTDWYLLPHGGEIEGPFKSKKLILHKLRAKTSTKTEHTGIYRVGKDMLFTRARAEALGIPQELLP